MAKFVLLILMIASALNGNCQSKKEKEQKIKDLFYDAEKHIRDSALNEAIAAYKEITQIAKKKSGSYRRAVYNIGYVYSLQGSDSAAEQVFLRIVINNWNELDKGGKGSGIMTEPYALYKNNAYQQLAHIEFKRNNYAKALEYIQTFHGVYPYRHFCGNELTAYHIYTAEMYSRAYLGLKDTVSAIKALLPEVIETGLAPNARLVNTVVTLLKAKYDKEYLVNQLNNAIDQLGHSKVHPVCVDRYENYHLHFMGTSIPVWGDMMFGNEYLGKTEIEKRKLFVKQSNFYKLLTDQVKPEDLKAFR